MRGFVYQILVLLILCGLCRSLSKSVYSSRVEDSDDDMMQPDGVGQKADSNIHNHLSGFANNTRHKFFQVLFNLSRYIPLSVEYAVTVGRNCNIIEYNSDYYGVPALIFAAILFIIGILFCFVGYRLLKINLFLIGFLIGGSFTYFIILAYIPATWKIYLAVCVAIVVGVICGLLTICIYYIGMFLAGGSVGFFITWFILSAIDIGYFQTHIYIPFLIAIAAGIICGIITLIFQKWLVILGTSIIGSFLIIWSLDYYLELGQMIYFLFLFAENRSSFKPCWFSWTVAVLFVIIAIAGFILQALVTGRKYDHKKDFEDGICCGLCKKCKKKKHSGDYVPLKNMD